MRAVILGAGGMLGHDLVATAPEGITPISLAREQLDITATPKLAAALRDARPDIVINAAAFTGVDRAESERELAFRVNSLAVGELGRWAMRSGVRVVHFSTDYVFDGTASHSYAEDSPTNPVNVYGESKLAGEVALQESGASFLIVRSQWLFGVNGRSFPKTMWDRATAGLPTRVVKDQTGRPTYTRDLARATWTLIVRGAAGILHVANQGQATWFDIASHLFCRAGKADLLTSCRTEDYPTPARRPQYSVLDTRRAESLLGAPLPYYSAALDDFVLRLTC